MSALTGARAAMRRAARLPRAGGAAPPRRAMSGAHEEPQVAWADYRSGDKTFAEWVDANRHVVAGGFFVFYSSLAAYALRPKKGAKETTPGVAAE